MTGEDFAIKPALLRAAVTYRVSATEVQALKDGDLQWQVSLAQVESLRLVELVLKGNRMSRIELALPDRVEKISQTLGARVPAEDHERQAWAALTASLLGGLARVRPETPVLIGETPRNRGLMFGVGVVSLIGAGGLGAAVLANGRVAEAGVPVLVMAAFGAWIAWNFHPWRAEVSFPAHQLAPAPDA